MSDAPRSVDRFGVVLGIVLAAALAIGSILLIVSATSLAWGVGRERPFERLLACSAIAVVAAGGGLMALMVRRRGFARHRAVASAAALALAAVPWIVVITDAWPRREMTMLRWGATLTVVALLLLQGTLLAPLAARRDPLAVARWGPLLCGLLAGVLGIPLAWLADSIALWLPEVPIVGIGSTTGGAAALALLGTVVLLAVARGVDRRRRAERESLPRRVIVAMACPGCAAEREYRPGLARCPDCGLAIVIELEEPRCACGFLLFGLVGSSCPECGRRVDAA